MSNICIILEVLGSAPMDFSCHFNRLSLYSRAILFERTSLFKTEMALKVYYQMYGYNFQSNQGHVILCEDTGLMYTSWNAYVDATDWWKIELLLTGSYGGHILLSKKHTLKTFTCDYQ